VRSGPGAARTILLLHTISARPSKKPRMVGSTLGVYSFALIFVSARTNKRHHHHVVVVYAGYCWLWYAVFGMACGAGPQLLVSRFSWSVGIGLPRGV
jgi:hypothetical protein